MKTLKLTRPATLLPISIEEAKLYLRADGMYDDTLVSDLVWAAAREIEDYTKRALMAQSWTMSTDSLSGLEEVDNQQVYISIPKPPLIKVDEIIAVRADGTQFLIDTTYYNVIAADNVARIIRKPGKSWPIFADLVCYRIEFTCGYETLGELPAIMKHVLLRLVAAKYEIRADYSIEIGGSIAPLPDAMKKLLAPYRRFTL